MLFFVKIMNWTIFYPEIKNQWRH